MQYNYVIYALNVIKFTFHFFVNHSDFSYHFILLFWKFMSKHGELYDKGGLPRGNILQPNISKVICFDSFETI